MMTHVRHRCFPVILLFLGILGALSDRTDAAKISWRNDFRKATTEANRLKKPLLIEVTATWCTYCQKMKYTYADSKIVSHVNHCFVPVAVDADANERLVKSLGVDGLPTTLIVSPRMKVLRRISGYQTPAQLGRQLQQVCQAGHTTPKRPVPAQAVAVRQRAIAFDRYCLVSLLDDKTLRKGSSRYTARYRGQTVCFSSAAHLKRFQANPQKYWPWHGGRCLVSAVEKRSADAGSPRWSALYGGQIWFFTDKAHRDRFARFPGKYVQAYRTLRR